MNPRTGRFAACAAPAAHDKYEFEKMIYPIVIYGNETLRKPSEPIAPDYPELKKLIEDMFLTLSEASGVGLAAPQIGKNIRLFIVDCTPWGDEEPACKDYKRAFINPEIYAASDETGLFNEGCLSLPGLYEEVRRPVARPRHPARIRPPGRQGLHRPPLAAAPQPAQEQAAGLRQRQVPLLLQGPVGTPHPVRRKKSREPHALPAFRVSAGRKRSAPTNSK